MKLNNAVLKLTAITVLAATVCSNAWARPPRSRFAEVKIEHVDVAARELIVSMNKKTVRLKWDENTKFVSCNTSADAAALKVGMVISISYRSPAFGDRKVRRVEFCTASTP